MKVRIKKAPKQLNQTIQNARKWKHSYGGSIFDLGGDLQTNGGDYSTGLAYINAGQSHELNPYEGVQVGVDSNGVPNLVEEGETIFNDYVFSNRIKLDAETKDKFHINRKRDYTYAEYSKKLEKEASERPNDAISQAALKAQMAKLQEEQERQKAEMEAEQAREAFEALSPEEQVAVMQQAQAQEQQAQEAAMQEQAMAEQQAMQQQPTPKEAAMMQQQMTQPQVLEPQAIEQPVMAYGGNLFAKGGKEDIINIIKNKRREGKGFIEWLTNLFYNHLEDLQKAGTALGNMGTAIGNATLGKTVDVGNTAGNNILQGISTAASNIKNAYYNALPWVERDYSDEEIAQMIEEEIARRENNNESVTEFLKEVYGDPVSIQKIEKNKKEENTFKPNYLDFSSIPDYHDPSKGSTPYIPKNDGNSASDFETAIANFKKVGVSPSDEEKVQHVIDNLTEDEKQQFSSLTNPKEQAAIIINASERLEKQESDTATSVKPAKDNQGVQTPVQKTTAGSSTYRNVGKLKEDPQTAWRKYVLPGLNKFIDSWADRINNAASQEEKNALTDQMINEFNGLQQSYYDSVWPNIGKSGYYYDPKVEAHQKDFSRMYGNTGFFVAQPNGTIVDAVGQAVNKAGSMGDNPSDGGIDGYNGPNTSLRNYGATMYGNADYYKPIIDRFRDLGVDYRLSDTLKNGDDALYVLSRRAPEAPVEEQPVVEDAAVSPEQPVDVQGVKPPEEPEDVIQRRVVPNRLPERNFGMYAPLVDLAMMATDIGKPDYSGLDRAQAIADRGPVLASYQPIGDYVRYSPFDIWSAQNRLDASNRATQRAILNQYSPSNNASQIALAYTENLGAGQLQRQGAESNLAQKLQNAEFNRGTNIQNANAFNALSQFNAGQQNESNQFRSQVALRNALERMDADASWYNSLYGNVNKFFENIAAREKENRDWNRTAEYIATLPSANPNVPVFSRYISWADPDGTEVKTAKGGRIHRKKNRRRGLTI